MQLERFKGHSPRNLQSRGQMLRKFAILLTVLLVAGEGSAAAPRKSQAQPKASTGNTATQLIQNCDAHKFETLVTAVVDGRPVQKRIKLCGVEGQSDADWIGTLNDAVKKIEADQQMASGVRDQIVSAIKGEVVRLKISASIPLPKPRRAEASPSSMASAISNDYPTLPPMPQSPSAPTAKADLASPPATSEPAEAVQKGFAQLPPLPPPPTAIAAVASSSATTSIRLPAPRVKFGCDSPGDLSSDAPCAIFERETVLTVHALEDVPGGTRLEFVRNNELRADVPLDGLRRGGALRLALPGEVCRGFTNGKLELRVVRDEGGAEQMSAEGPYSLNC